MKLRIELVHTFRAKAMAELSIGVTDDVTFKYLPNAFLVPNPFA
jgi:hypothetical protein